MQEVTARLAIVVAGLRPARRDWTREEGFDP